MSKVLGNHTRIFLDAYDLSVGGVEAMLASIKEAKDDTTVNDTAESRMMGAVGASEVSYSGLFDSAAGANFLGLKALAGSNTERAMSFHYGITVNSKSGLAMVKVTAVQNGVRHKELLPVAGIFVPNSAVEWGIVLYPMTTVTATTEGGACNNGAQTTAGGAWAYHVTAWSATGGNAKWTLTLQDSADGSTLWAAVAGEPSAINITAVGGARRAVAGTIKQYTRLLVTLDATSGSISVAATLIRT